MRSHWRVGSRVAARPDAHLKKISLVEDRLKNRLASKAEAGNWAGRLRLLVVAWTGCNSEGADMTDVGWKKKKGAGG